MVNKRKREDLDSEEESKKKKEKPIEKNDSEQQESNAEETEELPRLHPALVYLDIFKNNRKEWKFNKTHQKWVLTNCLNPKIVPTKYFKYTLEYCIDLQGNARKRQIEECEKMMEKQRKLVEEDLQDSDDENATVDPKKVEEELKSNKKYRRAQTLWKVLTTTTPKPLKIKENKKL